LPRPQAIPFSRQGVRAKVTLAHGGGGKAMKDLIDDVFVAAFDGAAPAVLEDQARFDLASFSMHGDQLAFTTDAFVVDLCSFRAATLANLPCAERSTISRSRREAAVSFLRSDHRGRRRHRHSSKIARSMARTASDRA